MPKVKGKYEVCLINFKYDRDTKELEVLYKKEVVATIPCESRVAGMKRIQHHHAKGDIVSYIESNAEFKRIVL